LIKAAAHEAEAAMEPPERQARSLTRPPLASSTPARRAPEDSLSTRKRVCTRLGSPLGLGGLSNAVSRRISGRPVKR